MNFNTVKALAAVLLLAACTPNQLHVGAQEPTADTACTLDGMVLRNFPGPKAQIQFAEGTPDYYCDLMELFGVVLGGEQKRAVAGIYVQDMAKADWDHPSGNWIEAHGAFYVVGSSKPGSMGPTFGAFGSEQGAQAFAAANGGKVLRFEQIGRDMLNMRAGGAHGGQPHSAH